MGGFFAAADALQRAQDKATSRKGGQALRKAMKREREAIEELVVAARRIGDGASEPTFDRVRETLEAAVGDPPARAALESGRFQHELRPGGGIVAASGSGSAAEADPDEEKRVAAEAELSRLQAALKKAEATAEEREAAKDEADRQLREVRGELATARAEVKKLRSQTRSAEEKLDRI